MKVRSVLLPVGNVSAVLEVDTPGMPVESVAVKVDVLPLGNPGVGKLSVLVVYSSVLLFISIHASLRALIHRTIVLTMCWSRSLVW